MLKYHRTDMTKAKCFRCGASAIGDTFEKARNKINHSVGLSRGIKCGDSYGTVKEIKDKLKPQLQKDTIQTQTDPFPGEPEKEKVPKKSKTKKEKYL